MHENTERTCTSADDLADLNLAAESEYRDFPGEQITVTKGYSQIVEHLAASLPPGTILLGRRLRRIEWCPDCGGPPDDGALPVRLYFADGTAVAVDHVIVTVSLGVLKAGLGKDGGGVAFDPALPSFKRDAIGRLGFGVVNKLFMELEAGAGAAAEPFPYLQMAFDQERRRQVAKIPWWMRRTESICPIYGGSMVALSWLAGKEAAQLEALGDVEVISGVDAAIDSFLPGARRVARVKRSRWGTDPLFLGSYSYVSVKSSGEDLDRMAEPLPGWTGANGVSAAALPLQILFAGEATHRTHYSTTHGAYLSGIREANRLLRFHRGGGGGGTT